MTGGYGVSQFISEAGGAARDCADAADCVQAIAPLMLQLVGNAKAFLTPAHYRSDPQHYARNALHISPDRSLSLYALVWLPGQWTPVHDHGSWGVVGVVAGVLEERAFMCRDGEIKADTGI